MSLKTERRYEYVRSIWVYNWCNFCDESPLRSISGARSQLSSFVINIKKYTKKVREGTRNYLNFMEIYFIFFSFHLAIRKDFTIVADNIKFSDLIVCTHMKVNWSKLHTTFRQLAVTIESRRKQVVELNKFSQVIFTNLIDLVFSLSSHRQINSEIENQKFLRLKNLSLSLLFLVFSKLFNVTEGFVAWNLLFYQSHVVQFFWCWSFYDYFK